MPLYEVARSPYGRDAIYALLTSAEPQPRRYNTVADHNEEGNVERQINPGLKEAFSEMISIVQALAKGATPIGQSGLSLNGALRFMSFFEECTRDKLAEKHRELKGTNQTEKRAKLEQSCKLLSEDTKIIEAQREDARLDPCAYFQSVSADKAGADIGKAESAAG